MKKVYFKLFFTSIIFSFVFCINSYCAEEGTLKMQINNGTRWTQITIGDAYEECEDLNSTSSTLGTSALKAHLTTDYDYSAVAIFGVGQYGGGFVGQYGGSATGNNSGVQMPGNSTGVYCTTVSKADKYNEYVSKLFDSNGNPRKYVNVFDQETFTDQNGRQMISLISMLQGGTSGFNGETASNPDKGSVGVKSKYFNTNFRGATNVACHGYGSPNVSFRPVIWN